MAGSLSPGQCGGTSPITDGGHNLDSGTSCGFGIANSLSDTDPMLGALAENGGPTKTHALLEGSPAIDKGDSFGATTDQRGVERPQGAASDMGAFEVEDTTAPKVSTATPTGKGVARGTNVAATFSEEMDASSINGTTFKLTKKGSTTKISATLSLTASTDTATLDPTNLLRGGVTYKAVVTTGAKDLAGNNLDQKQGVSGNQAKTWTLTTRG